MHGGCIGAENKPELARRDMDRSTHPHSGSFHMHKMDQHFSSSYKAQACKYAENYVIIKILYRHSTTLTVKKKLAYF